MRIVDKREVVEDRSVSFTLQELAEMVLFGNQDDSEVWLDSILFSICDKVKSECNDVSAHPALCVLTGYDANGDEVDVALARYQDIVSGDDILSHFTEDGQKLVDTIVITNKFDPNEEETWLKTEQTT